MKIDQAYVNNVIGLVCSQCGNTQWSVSKTMRVQGEVKRIRKCRICGYNIHTSETSTTDQGDKQ